jgi:hypothetical protein
MNMSFKLAAGAAAVMLSLGANAAPVIVDLFTTDQATITDNDGALGGGATSSVTTAGTDILGGERDLLIDQIAQDGPIDPSIESSIGVAVSRLAFSNDTGAMGVGEVQWDGVDGSGALDATGLGGLDLTAGGTLNAFLIETISSDANWNFEVIAYTDATNWTRISFAATEVPSGTGPVFSTISFNGFTNDLLCGQTNPVPGVNEITCSGTGVDLANLGALQLILNTGNAGLPSAFDIDLRLANITTVPEPGVLGLMGLGLMAAGFASRRRKSQA